jgi:hypothetical protein
MDIQNPVIATDAEHSPPCSAPPVAALQASERQGPIALPLWTEMSGSPALP